MCKLKQGEEAMTGNAKAGALHARIQTGGGTTGESGSKIGRGVGDASRGAAEPSQLGHAGPGRPETSQTRH